MKIKIVKPTMVGGKLRAPGDELEVPKATGVELCVSKKAERIDGLKAGGLMTTAGAVQVPKVPEPPKA